MTNNSSTISFSPSTISKFLDCNAFSWFRYHENEIGELSVNTLYADIGNAIHNCLLEVQKYAKKKRYVGDKLEKSFFINLFETNIEIELSKFDLSSANQEVAEKILSVQSGIHRCIELIINDMNRWCIDENTNELLVWEECWLDHNDNFEGVFISEQARSKTRADVIGICNSQESDPYVLIRDYKTGKNLVDPSKDLGLLMRGVWALIELNNPSANWFVKDRPISVSTNYVVLEVVNLAAGDSKEFISRVVLNNNDLSKVQNSFLQVMKRIQVVKQSPKQLGVVQSSPGGLCRDYCPYLHRCDLGKHHVALKFGIDNLEKRILTNQKAYEIYKQEKNTFLDQITSIGSQLCPFCNGLLRDAKATKPTKYIKSHLQCENFEKCGFQIPSLRKMKKI
tara:strand:+ start:5168 stop:6352 length:1185 start_codon:yes stop_codon:yes gene_type:complete